MTNYFIALLLVGVVACSTDTDTSVTTTVEGGAHTDVEDNESTSIALGASANGTTVYASVGQLIEITINNVGPGEYGTPSVSSSSVKFLNVSVVAPYLPSGPTQLFRFNVSAQGTSVVKMVQSASGAEYVITIVVE